MTIDERVINRLHELIQAGQRVLATKRVPASNMIGFDSFVDSEMAYQWFTSSQSLLERVFGTQSAHYKNFSVIAGKQGISYSPVVRGQGILRAALEDYEGGYLFDVRRLLEAEVFADLLSQAESLLGAGYNGPAAVVAGCVLEDGLRKLCNAHSIAIPDRAKLDLMNSELAKSGVYSKLVQKQITAYADIRNNAAHGKWEAFTSSDVASMISWVTRFLGEEGASSAA